MAKLPVPTLGIYDLFEFPGSPEESFTTGIGRVRRVFLCEWEDRWVVAQGLMGWAEILPGELDFEYIHRVPPHSYKDITRIVPTDEDNNALQQNWLFATQLESITGVAPRGLNSNDVGYYEKAKITVTYESLTYDPHSDEYAENKGWLDLHGNPCDLYITTFGSGPGGTTLDAALPVRYISRTFHPTAEYLTLPYGQLLWADDGTPAATGAGKIIASMEVQYTWHQVPSSINNVSSQITRIFNHLGKVNKYTFDFFPPGTLLLTAVETKPYRQIGGGYMSDITFKMKYFNASSSLGVPTNKGHNHFLKFNSIGLPAFGNLTNSYDYVLLTSNGLDTGRRVYDEYDFSFLFLVSEL